jgi:amino acid transporter
MIPVAGSAYTYTYATLGELLAWTCHRLGPRIGVCRRCGDCGYLMVALSGQISSALRTQSASAADDVSL